MTNVTSSKIGNLKTKTKSTDAKNKDQVKAKVKEVKELMYLYKGIEDTKEAKKKHRTQMRAAKRKFEKSLAAAKKNDKAPIIKEATAWAKGTYTKSHIPTF